MASGMEHRPGLKMYWCIEPYLKMGDIPASYVSLSEGVNIVLVFEAAFFSQIWGLYLKKTLFWRFVKNTCQLGKFSNDSREQSPPELLHIQSIPLSLCLPLLLGGGASQTLSWFFIYQPQNWYVIIDHQWVDQNIVFRIIWVWECLHVSRCLFVGIRALTERESWFRVPVNQRMNQVPRMPAPRGWHAACPFPLRGRAKGK